MSKERITPENVFFKPNYQDILKLLIEFQDVDGLSFEFLKHVLVKGYNKHFSIFKSDKYRRTRQLALSKKIKPNSITTENNLVRYLRKLRALNIIEPPIDKNLKGINEKTKYKIVEEFYDNFERELELKQIEEYPINQRIYFGGKTDIYSPLIFYDDKSLIGHFAFYGIQKNLLNQKEKEIIKNEARKLFDICKNLEKIKSEKWETEEKELANSWLKQKNSEAIKSLFKKYYPYPIDFVYISDIFIPDLAQYTQMPTKEEFYKWFGLIMSNDKLIDIDLKYFKNHQDPLDFYSIKDFNNREVNIDEFKKNHSKEEHIYFYLEFCNQFFFPTAEVNLNINLVKEIVDFLWEYANISIKWLPIDITIFARTT